MTHQPGFVAVITVQSRLVGLSFSVAELMTRVVLALRDMLSEDGRRRRTQSTA